MNTVGGPAASDQAIASNHEKKLGDNKAPRVPAWVSEHKYVISAAEALLLIVLAVFGASHGPVETFLLEAAAVSVQIVAWEWGCQRRRVAHWNSTATASYVERELAAIDLLTGSAFEAYIVKLLTALGYWNASRTGNNHDDMSVDIVAETPGRSSMVGVECKRQEANVKSKVVNQLVGSVNMNPYKGYVPILITSAALTSVADRRAKRDNVTVYQREGIQRLIAQCRLACWWPDPGFGCGGGRVGA